MRIGLDFDGVIADTIPAMVSYARERMGLEVEPRDCIVPRGIERLGIETYRQLVAETHDSDYALGFQPTHGAYAALRDMAAVHELYIVTARAGPAFANAMRWLESHGIDGYFADVQSSAEMRKTELADRLVFDWFVDDVPETFRDWSANAIPALWHTDYNSHIDVAAPIKRVHGWPALVELL